MAELSVIFPVANQWPLVTITLPVFQRCLPEAVAFLRQALDQVKQARHVGLGKRNQLLEQSIAFREAAKGEILE